MPFDGWMDEYRWMDGWMDGWIGGWMDGSHLMGVSIDAWQQPFDGLFFSLR